MKIGYLFFLTVCLSVFLMSSLAFAAPNLNDGWIYSYDGEWTISGSDSTAISPYYGTATHPDKFYINEYGYSNGDGFDVQKLSLFIDDGYLYYGLQTTFDLDDGRNGLTTGDLALNFYDPYNINSIYDFAIDLSNIVEPSSGNSSSQDLNVYQASSADDWVETTASGSITDPWKLDDNEKISDNLVGISTTMVSKTSDKWNDYYRRTIEGKIDLALLTSKLSSFYSDGSAYAVQLHYTMECGNDYLDKAILYGPTTDQTGGNAVPEPATLLLFGMGLLGAGAYGRKRQKKENK